MKQAKNIKLGDIFEIPLPNGKKAYGHYVWHDDKTGTLIQVFKQTLDQDEVFSLSNFNTKEYLFPAIYTVLKPTLNSGMWKIVENYPATNFSYPGFVATFYNEKGVAGLWFLWDGDKFVRIGNTLQDEYKKLEFYAVYSPIKVVERIVNGVKPYKDLIEKNHMEMPEVTPLKNKNESIFGNVKSINFNNDEALDFINDFVKKPTISFFTNLFNDPPEEYLDNTNSQRILTAVEMLAYLVDENDQNLPEAVRFPLKKLALKINRNELQSLAKVSKEYITKILDNSELKESWKESKLYNVWIKENKSLLLRLENYLKSEA
ncbi:MAG TPA: DUF4259 domain-containing protein [Vitreimonas sp.]|nr:DUF4259 domain-containing protein [Vitreimonas sp.]